MSDSASVYSLSLDGSTHRYVGKTTRTAVARLASHRKGARLGVRLPLYEWMREVGPHRVRVTVLEECAATDIDARETHWIAHLRGSGFDLLNVSDGGHPKNVSALGTHSRWHLNRGITKPGCSFCDEEDSAAA